MKAMVLAAGLGTRLRPLTNDRPKALVEARAAARCWRSPSTRLKAFGIREVIVNVHHFADMVVDYLKANGNFGMRHRNLAGGRVAGYGRWAEKGWLGFYGTDEPFVLHNVDVISTIDLHRMAEFHKREPGSGHPGCSGSGDIAIFAFR